MRPGDCSSRCNLLPACGEVVADLPPEMVLGARHEQAWFRGEKPTGGVYPAATIKRGCARIAAGTNEVRFGGPCRGRTYGPLIKSPGGNLPQETQHEESAAKEEDL